MEKIPFLWNVKEKPEDFIVKEVSHIERNDSGRFFLYLLIKRNMNTSEIAGRFNLSYAGLKDKNALTFQYVSSERFIGNVYSEKGKNSFFALLFLYKISRKLRIGNLMGNIFSIKLKSENIKPQDWFINYYDVQRLSRNAQKGKKLLLDRETKRSYNWLERFYIDAYLSFLWNKAVEVYLKEHYSGYIITENKHSFFIPETSYTELMEKVQKFWSVLGYKVKLSSLEKQIYTEILKDQETDLETITNRLRKLKVKGDYRKTFLRAENIKIKNGRINFFLPKGAYATMFLKHIYAKNQTKNGK